jgi:hypothetical protein
VSPHLWGGQDILYDVKMMQTIASLLSLDGYEAVWAGNSHVPSDNGKTIPLL